jgi:hypothetical protein
MIPTLGIDPGADGGAVLLDPDVPLRLEPP